MKKFASRLPAILCLVLIGSLAYGLNDSTITLNAEPPSTRLFQTLSLPPHPLLRHDPIVVGKDVIADTILNKRAHAHALLEKVLQGQRFLETLDAFSEIELPVGVVKSGGVTDYSILIDRIRFTRDGARMDVYASLALPQTGIRLAFHGEVPLSAQGGIAGSARIFLLGDHRMQLGAHTLVTLRGTDRTYIEFDCSGFLGVHLDAEMEFSADLIVPEDLHGNVIDERLKIAFTTYTESLHDIILSVTLPPFQVKSLPGFGFHATQAHLDWSDFSNPVAIVFPEAYPSPVVKAGLPELWQGIFIEEAEVRLPSAFARRTGSNRISVGVQDLIIDDQGVTGAVYARNVIADGDMSGWNYTVDLLTIALTESRPTAFALEGLLSIPVVRDRNGQSTEFKYVAQRGASGDYIFSIAVETELRLALWAADINLSTGSGVTVSEQDGKFIPSARLNGDLTFNFLGDGPKASFNSIRFEELVIHSQAPHFRPGTFGFGRDGEHASISGYPIVLNNISVKSEDSRVGLAFDVMVNISGKPKEGGFAGKGGLIVWGVQDSSSAKKDSAHNAVESDKADWKFDKLEMTSLKLDIRIPKVVELAGSVRFFDKDETYGDGFKGALKGSINAIQLQAEALFGKTDAFRYWYADALVELRNGIPIMPGVLSAFGFGGGYYSKMKQGVSSGSVTLGRSPSGITYVPDENTIGIRAIVLIGTPRPEAMRGDVSLEVSINRHGGINSVTFTGNANFMSTASTSGNQIKQLAAAAVGGNLTEKLGSLKRGQVFGSVKLHFDNVNDVFHGNLEIYVNVAGGLVRGVSEGNKAGWAVMHFEKTDWYIHIGTPDQPLGLEVARIFKSKSYFMLGKNLPGSPPPPPQVSEILGNVDLDYMRDMNALESGMGIAFGLHFLVDTGDLRFLMFYGRFSAGTGLDFMLKDYGSEYHCAGSSRTLGINGWYANGQAYAFVMGKIGIKVNLRFYKGTYDILSIGAAAVLQAKGPNPFWMKGTVGGYYKILGGLVKGKCRFEVTVGKDCKPVTEQNLLDEVNMIASISPERNASDVDVFVTPQLAFNVPVGETFEIKDLENNRHQFRATLDVFTLSAAGFPVAGTLTWNADKDVVVFDAHDILPPKTRCSVRATLVFEKKTNGVWSKVRFQGQEVKETAETSFVTGPAPDVIPPENVSVAYPLVNQQNFYREEYPSGFIELTDGQPYLFDARTGWVHKVRWLGSGSEPIAETGLRYDRMEKRIHFVIPEAIENGHNYEVQVVTFPVDAFTTDQNVTEVATNLKINASAGHATLTTQSIDGNLSSDEPRVLFRYQFRASEYSTFRQKMKSISLSPALRSMHGVFAFRLRARFLGAEPLSAEEVSDGLHWSRLVQAQAVLEDNKWFEKIAFPSVYAGLAAFDWLSLHRSNPDPIGIPPAGAISFGSAGTGSSHQTPGTPTPNHPMDGGYISYDVGEVVVNDFRQLQRQAVNFLVDHPTRSSPGISAFITNRVPYIRHGNYGIRLTYNIPGTTLKTSTYELKIFNPVPDSE